MLASGARGPNRGPASLMKQPVEIMAATTPTLRNPTSAARGGTNRL